MGRVDLNEMLSAFSCFDWLTSFFLVGCDMRQAVEEHQNSFLQLYDVGIYQ